MIEPRLLTRGDRVAIVAPAGKLPEKGIDRAIAILKSWGLEVVLGRNVYGQHGYFSGTDVERLADLHNALEDPTIAAVLFARGGYGVTRILDQINLEVFRQTPKWLIGFSDITALHLRLLQEEILSVHGDVGTTLGLAEDSAAALKDLLFEGKSTIVGTESLHEGKSEAPITGGNLSLLVDSLGTPTEVNTENRILFIEEIEEKTYRIDRMLHQLKRAGKLDNLAGLVIGHFTNVTDGSTPFGSTWKDCFMQLLEGYNYPVSFSFPIGHEPRNYPILHGAEYQLTVTGQGASLDLNTTRK